MTDARLNHLVIVIRDVLLEETQHRFEVSEDTPGDPMLWCSDSNASIRPRAVAEAVLEALDAEAKPTG